MIHTKLVRGEIARLQVKIELLENVGRRYLLTGVEEDLAVMPGLHDDISVRQLRLRELTRDNPDQQARLDQADAAMQSWYQDIAEPEIKWMDNPASRDEATQRVKSGEGTTRLDNLSRIPAEMQDADRALVLEP